METKISTVKQVFEVDRSIIISGVSAIGVQF